ncbi:MobQ family relaxase [Shinella sp. DD12]|uniref:MobQ family relaxase n=1 Tax=Shinella sp. DD12 TaxID=1410620 RepID=UPI000437A4C0|nr:MobQ family relaxase [Shinella sp. DD12]EYR78520.1 conjugal transfer protein TraA [Shinella sp. DD12]
MAIYHFSGQVLGRTVKANPDGKRRLPSNAVAAAAYRSGQRLVDRASGQVHDYSQQRGVVHEEVMVPAGAAPWLENRELLWNTVEAMEKRRDAQLAREFNMALPHELDAAQRLELVRDFVGRQFVQMGMVADIALHDPIAAQGQNRFNFHAHVMLTLRKATPDGLHPAKTREWNSKELLNVWRAEWALACNVALERGGKRVKVDHRTLQAQRDEAVAQRDMARASLLDREPEIHVGPKSKQAVRGQRLPVSRNRELGPYRVRRKLDYWERRIAFWAEEKIRGPEFRYQRWQEAEGRKKAEHAREWLSACEALSDEMAVLVACSPLNKG